MGFIILPINQHENWMLADYLWTGSVAPALLHHCAAALPPHTPHSLAFMALIVNLTSMWNDPITWQLHPEMNVHICFVHLSWRHQEWKSVLFKEKKDEKRVLTPLCSWIFKYFFKDFAIKWKDVNKSFKIFDSSDGQLQLLSRIC